MPRYIPNSKSPAAHPEGRTVMVNELRAMSYETAAALTGLGTSTVSGAHSAIAAASLTGTGSSTTSGVRTVAASAALAGAGSLAAAGAHNAIAAAALHGNGTLSTNGTDTRFGAAALAGTGTQTVAGSPTRVGQAALSGTGTSTQAGLHTAYATAALAGSGSLSVQIDAPVQPAVATGGNIVITGRAPQRLKQPRDRRGEAHLIAFGRLTAAGVVTPVTRYRNEELLLLVA